MKRKQNTLHKTHSSLRIDTAYCRVEDMHSENTQVHTVFFYCSGDERSLKCVRPALEMKASKEEQRGVVCFLMAKGAETYEILRCMSAVYSGKYCMSLTRVHEWQKRFHEERTSLQDDSHLGQAH